MSKHTPGQLHVGPYYKTDVESREGTVAECRVGTARGEANARRIVACWNACEGINPEAVPELLKVAKALELAGDLIVPPADHRVVRRLSDLRAAIAKAEATNA